ncbi:MAG TPA: response regulator [Solirubrobacteraceae bacterium]|jgi:two-component system OmpR family response regulator|nr:response regulator [Solirubrobacteraceae bacterium]
MSSRLLLVDDDDAIRTIASISLERIGGWTVISASSGQAALEAAQDDGPFDAVLMDVMMPDLDGPTTLKRMRDGVLTLQVPIVFLTAKVGNVERERLLLLGANGMIAKPFDPMTLPDELQQILDRTP